MNDVAIQVENLSKLFYIGHLRERRPMREVLLQAAVTPFRRAGQLLTGHAAATSDMSEPLWALKDVSFAVKHGQALGIIGRNGAGKSTLLKILSRITEPTSGRAVVRGRIGSLLEVGTGFHPDLSGRDNVYLNGTMLGMRRAEVARKFDEIVAFAEIEKFIDTPVKHYSSGMYTRLAFAVAAHLEPEILICDEVLAVGDAEFQNKCLAKMGDVIKSGRTVLFVSHSMPAIQRLCPRALMLQAGKILYDGVTDRAVDLYLDSHAGEYVAGAPIQWRREPPYPPAPHFRRAWLCHADGSPCVTPTSAGHFGVAAEIWLPEARGDLIVALSVFDGRNQPLFSSSPQDCGVLPPDRPGLYRMVVLPPPAILMPGKFTAGLALYSPAVLFDSQMKALNFTVAEVASLANQTHGGRIGGLQVLCAWRPFERLSGADASASPVAEPVVAA